MFDAFYHISYHDRLCTTELVEPLGPARMQNYRPVQVIQKRHKVYDNDHWNQFYYTPCCSCMAWWKTGNSCH